MEFSRRPSYLVGYPAGHQVPEYDLGLSITQSQMPRQMRAELDDALVKKRVASFRCRGRGNACISFPSARHVGPNRPNSLQGIVGRSAVRESTAISFELAGNIDTLGGCVNGCASNCNSGVVASSVWPSPSGPSCQKWVASGPRCSSIAHIALRPSSATGVWSRLNSPQIPLISSLLLPHDGTSSSAKGLK